jgi:hypothetical protein
MDGNFHVEFVQDVSHEENQLAEMLLYIAHENPNVVENGTPIYCMGLHFPGKVAAQFAHVDPRRKTTTIPAEDFVRIIKKMEGSQYVLDLITDKGKRMCVRAPYLPVLLFENGGNPYVLFVDHPQCYFKEVTIGTQKVRLPFPCGKIYDTYKKYTEKRT